MDRQSIFKKINRVIIKIGSKALADKDNISYDRIKFLATDIRRLRESGIECLLVSSGAILAGNEFFNFNLKRLNIIKKQAVSSLVQVKLMSYYIKAFS